MANLFRIGSNYLTQAFKASGSEVVEYYTANGTLVPTLTLATVIGMTTDNNAMPLEGYQIEDKRIDFVVSAADLGVNIPEDGWYFMYNGVKYTCFSFAGKYTTDESDEFGNRIRIHTRKYRD